jgi:transposase-like protein
VSQDPKNHEDHSDGTSVLELIRRIKSGAVNRKGLSVEDRRACVQHMSLEGMTVPEIAQVLGVGDRTIRRDRKAIQQANALDPDPNLVYEMAGRLWQEAEASRARIRQITRSGETDPSDRIEGERVSFDILDKLMARLQSLGMLPTSSQKVEAELTHHLGDQPSLEEIQSEAQRMQQFEQPSEVSSNTDQTNGDQSS